MSAKKYFIISSLIIIITSICGPAMAATQAQIDGAINNGVAWLVTQQNSSTGYWYDASSTAGPTGLALIKLEERAFELGYTPFDPCYSYDPNVEKGLAYLFSQMSIISTPNQPAGNPDTDGDGNGVYVSTGAITYETGIAMMAIAASRDPNRVVNSPGSPVHGWTYKQVLVDMVDYMAFGQCDSGSGRGGWGYSHNAGSDNSNSGYAVSGLGYAESPRYGFNCTIPQFVKDELKFWIDYIQTDGGDDDGGSGYSGPGDWVNILKTGNLVFQMTFAGIAPADPNFQRALAYIGRKWNDSSSGWGNPAYGGTPNCQAMYCTANGLWYSNINDVNQRDWYADFADALVNAQQSGGYWPDNIYGGDVLGTEWALLTLERPSSPWCGVTLTKTDVNDGNCVGPGNEITYTICYSYHGDANCPDINDVNIIDYLPNEVEFVSSVPEPNEIIDSNKIIWEIGTLKPGDSNCITLTVMVKCAEPNSTITNHCEIRSSGQVLRSAYEYTPVCSPTLTKVDNITGCVGPGDNITYSICYAANGYGDTSVVITDTLPTGVEFVSATGNYEYNSGTVTWNIGTLGPNDSNCVTVTVQVKCAGPGSTITNSCQMSGDCIITPISAVENTPVCSWYPTLTKVDNITSCVGPGENFNYSICYAANGYGDTNVVITDVLPNEVNYVSSGYGGSYNPGNRTVTWNIGTLEPNESGCVELVVQVNTTAESLGTITNCCRMTGDCIDINACENTPVCCWPVRIIYVDADANGSNNGTSWEDAYKYMQDALTDTSIDPVCVEIWVAEGIYWPDINSAYPDGTGNREATFQLINGVEIKGGYAGVGEPNPDAHDIRKYETVLSGDLLDNDRQVAEPCDLLNDPCRAENSFQVVTGNDTNETAILDGFTITAGNANDANYIYVSGGGLYVYNGGPTVRNCMFKRNSAQSGGGIYNAIYNYDISGPNINNCAFIENGADYGGGLCTGYHSTATVAVTNCTFVGNGSDYGGGGIYLIESTVTVTNSILWGNDGGQIAGYGSSVTYSDIEGGWEGVGNIDKYPMFEADGLHLSLCSPCIDAGDPNGDYQGQSDIDGEDRIMNGRCVGEAVVDMGADEYLPDCDALLYAYCLKPDCGTVTVLYVGEAPDINLVWHPGTFAAYHDVYFGTTFSDVNNATTETPIIYKGRQSETDYLVRDLNVCTTYYWRIDEVNDPYIWPGSVCSFRTGLFIDDFERYSDANDMNQKWQTDYEIAACGSGIFGYADLALVNSGEGKQMQYTYHNVGYEPPHYVYFSEARLEYDQNGANWTVGPNRNEPNTLVIPFKGASNNSADPNYDRMYVVIEDTAGHFSEEINNPDPNAQTNPYWHEWRIPFTDINGTPGNVNLKAVKYLYIGFGNRCQTFWSGEGIGGDGNVMFDNIRLEPPEMSSYGFFSDFTCDCFVNFNDFAIMGQEWLTEGIKADIYPENNPDDIVDLMDLEVLADEWLK